MKDEITSVRIPPVGGLSDEQRLGRICELLSKAVVADWTRTFPDLTDRMEAGWAEAHPDLAARLGAEADRTGLQIARAWVGLI